MRIRIVVAGFLILLVSFTSHGPARGQVPKKDQAAPLRDLFQELDTGGDRVISPEEVPAQGKLAFEALLKHGDSDHDGKLSAAEYRTLMQRAAREGAATAPRAQRERRFAQLDANKDRKLDAAELPGGSAQLNKMDRNGDGYVARDEFVAAAPARPGAAAKEDAEQRPGTGPMLERLKAMDRDHDGRVSREEFSGRPAAFNRLDTNHDGYLDRADRKGQGAKAAKKKAGAKEKLRA